ncbi:unnamed protein product [Coffea canephora]|uniref:Uncharacterized protein n=1 Tax=Coffea canephora TaxID=49390 RepID=A0A068UEF9_COFCA|nr:unnamed protein product [Coffea canephora]
MPSLFLQKVFCTKSSDLSESSSLTLFTCMIDLWSFESKSGYIISGGLQIEEGLLSL